MVYESLITIVENNLNELTTAWSQEVKKNAYLKKYKELDQSNLNSRGQTLFSNLLDWLNKGASNDQAANYFTNVGMERFEEGFPLSEVYLALYLEKKILWKFVIRDEKITGSLKALDALEFMTVINNYFDLGDFYIIKGYYQKLNSYLKSNINLNDDELEKISFTSEMNMEETRLMREQLFKEGLTIDEIK